MFDDCNSAQQAFQAKGDKTMNINANNCFTDTNMLLLASQL